MHRVDVESWEAFEVELAKLREVRTAIRMKSAHRPSPFLFRGERDETWNLETTLERRSKKEWSIAEYFRLTTVAKPMIETFTARRWEMPDYLDLRTWAREYDNLKLSQFPGYDYLAFLRHHGFPSPLLDWTASPFVAAYFAFARASEGRVAIYAYMEYAGSGKFRSSERPQIVSFGPNVRSHSRHFLQQSQYTICAQYRENEWWYAPHERVFQFESVNQDRLWKFTVPALERVTVLRRLDAFNLNEFSLFQTDEALLEMIATREIELRERDA